MNTDYNIMPSPAKRSRRCLINLILCACLAGGAYLHYHKDLIRAAASGERVSTSETTAKDPAVSSTPANRQDNRRAIVAQVVLTDQTAAIQ